MNSAVNDIRYAHHGSPKRPGISSVVIVMLAVGIAVTTLIFMMMQARLMTSLSISSAEDLVMSGDAAGEGTSIGDPRVPRWDPFSFSVYPRIQDHTQPSQHVCAFRSGVSRPGKRKTVVGSGLMARAARGSKNRETLTTRYQILKGMRYGQPNKRHPFCASQFTEASGVHGNRAPDSGIGNRRQCGIVLSC